MCFFLERPWLFLIENSSGDEFRHFDPPTQMEGKHQNWSRTHEMGSINFNSWKFSDGTRKAGGCSSSVPRPVVLTLRCPGRTGVFISTTPCCTYQRVLLRRPSRCIAVLISVLSWFKINDSHQQSPPNSQILLEDLCVQLTSHPTLLHVLAC